MGKDSLIQWCDSTINPTTGCDGCELWTVLSDYAERVGHRPTDRESSKPLKKRGGPCYAGNQHEGRLALAMPSLYSPDFTEVRLVPGRMAKAAAWSDLRGKDRPDKPWLNGMPRVIFVEDMGDLFSKAVPFGFIKREVCDTAVSPKGSRHIYMLLTKQPNRMLSFYRWLVEDMDTPWPKNVWAGTSVTSMKTVHRPEPLTYMFGVTKFLSVEPQWEAVEFSQALLQHMSLVIQGGESDQGEHRGRPFDLAWARSLRDQCRLAWTTYLLKQLGSNPFNSANRISIDGPDSHAVTYECDDSHGGDPDEWPTDLQGCREFPALA